MDAQEIFRSVVKGVNPFTSVIEAYYKIDDTSAIELAVMGHRDRYISKGTTFEDMVGVTVVSGLKMDSDKSMCFKGMSKALEYVNSFKPTQKVIFERYNSYGDKRKRVIDLTTN